MPMRYQSPKKALRITGTPAGFTWAHFQLSRPRAGASRSIARQGCRQKMQRKSGALARVRARLRRAVVRRAGSPVSRAGALQVRGRVRQSPGRARPKVWALSDTTRVYFFLYEEARMRTRSGRSGGRVVRE